MICQVWKEGNTSPPYQLNAGLYFTDKPRICNVIYSISGYFYHGLLNDSDDRSAFPAVGEHYFNSGAL